MRARALALGWLAAGVILFNGILDLYVSRGAREYGQKQAEAALAGAPGVSMDAVMASATRDGVIAGSYWAAGVILSGWATIWLLRRRAPAAPASDTRPALH